MQTTGQVILLCALVALAPQLMAQDEQAQREAEMVAQQEALEAAGRDLAAAAKELEASGEESEVAMREAEKRLEEAARRIADLSQDRARMAWAMQRVEGIRPDRAMLGVMLGDEDEKGPVAGVEIVGVTPGGGGEQAGLQAGDIITAIDGDSFSADNSARARELLLGFMEDVEVGQELKVEYLRDGKASTVAVVTQEPAPRALEFFTDVHGLHPIAPGDRPRRFDMNEFVTIGDRRGWGDMELVELSKELGRYFNADGGLLVVRAPDERSLQLQDGDVILKIDGREPQSVRHAMRILGSYQTGEKLEMQIMRDKKRKTIKVEMPEFKREFNIRMAPAGEEKIIRKEMVIKPEKD
jgi:S1-C subfamily serine protease